MQYIKNFFILFLLLISTFGCSGVNFSEWHFPYMMNVQQGNLITNDEYKRLKIGMTKEQASYIVGHPLTQFLFNENRWDLVYQMHQNNDLKKSYDVTILFDKNNKIKHISKTGELFDK
jgi:outer membrane protein assembly factor BamE